MINLKNLLLLPALWYGEMSVAQNPSSSLLWKVEGNGLPAPSYIYGTIHMIDVAHFQVRPEVDSVFNLTEQVAFEIKMDDPAMMTTIQSWMPMPQGKSLSDYCTAEEYQQLAQWASGKLGMDIAMFAGMKPFALYQTLIMSYIEGEMASYEGYFMSRSMTSGKMMFGLETIEDQLKIFDSIPFEEQMDWMIEGLDTTAGYGQMWEKMITTYASEDIEAMYTLTIQESPEIEHYEDLFLTARNKNWIARIRQHAAEKPTFVAVGAAHLGGPNGVIKLLKDAGYTVTPL